MVEKQTQTIIIDNVEYKPEDFTDEQKTLINHITDLERKINSTKFNLDQLAVGKDSFCAMLKASLEAKSEVPDD